MGRGTVALNGSELNWIAELVMAFRGRGLHGGGCQLLATFAEALGSAPEASPTMVKGAQ